MPMLDLRPEAPPLGYHSDQVPPLDVSSLATDQNRLFRKNGTPYGVWLLPKYPDFVLRGQVLYEELDHGPLRTIGLLRQHIEKGNRHFGILEALGIHVVAHRHIGATLPDDTGEGELLTIARRLSSSHETLDPGNNAHLPGCLTALNALFTYAHDRVNDTSPTPDVLIDPFKAEQFSLNTLTGAVVLHDTGIEIRQIHEFGLNYQPILTSISDLHLFAKQATQTAQGTSSEQPITEVYIRIQSELPEPWFDE